MASQPNLSPSNQARYMGLEAPVLPGVRCIVTPVVAAATTSSPILPRINNISGDIERTELEPDSSNTESTQVEHSLEDNIPKVGMKFNTEQEAYDYYNAYAREKGFSIRRSSSHNVKNTNTIKNRTFCC
ncbi:unnamed protein product, partial [Urochloa humidicola]